MIDDDDDDDDDDDFDFDYDDDDVYFQQSNVRFLKCVRAMVIWGVLG